MVWHETTACMSRDCVYMCVWEGGGGGGGGGEFRGWAMQYAHTLHNITYYFVFGFKSTVCTAALFDLVHLILQVHLSLNVLYHHL